MWSATVFLKAESLAVTSVEVAVSDPSQWVRLQVSELDLEFAFSFDGSLQTNTNPDVIKGIGVIWMMPQELNKVLVELTLLSSVVQEITALWTAAAGVKIENPKLTVK